VKLTPRTARILRWGTAGVWLAFGLLAKVLSGVPRHRAIVGRVLGDTWAAPLTLAIGLGEVAMGAWILSGRARRTCALAQTLVIGLMNTLELTLARDLLVTPVGMVLLNLGFLGAGWVLALAEVREDESCSPR